MILEPLINTHKIKYSIMDELIKKIEIKKEAENVNVFINLDSIFSQFYRDDIVDAIKSLNSNENVTLCSEIANIAAHYRRYFWTRHNLRTTFYFYYMNKKPKYNKSLYPEYADALIEKKSKKNTRFTSVNTFINQNLRLFAILSLYLPQVYFILSDGLEPALIPFHFIKKADEEDINLVLTKDEYEFQLVSRKNTYLLRMKYDKSDIIDRTNLFDYLLKKNKYEPTNFIDGKYFENILPMISCKSRSVKAMKGYGKVALLKKIDKNFEMLDPSMSFNLLLNLLNIDITDDVFDRYKCMNLKSQYKRLTRLEKMRMEEFVEDRFENRTIMQINSEHFPYNPVKLIELSDGVRYY